MLCNIRIQRVQRTVATNAVQYMRPIKTAIKMSVRFAMVTENHPNFRQNTITLESS